MVKAYIASVLLKKNLKNFMNMFSIFCIFFFSQYRLYYIEEKIYFSPEKIKNSEFLHSKFFKILGLF